MTQPPTERPSDSPTQPSPEPTPAPPPWELPTSPRTDLTNAELVGYFETQLEWTTADNLAWVAGQSGYSREAVAAALDEAQRRRAAVRDRMGGLKTQARGITILAYALGFLVIVAPLIGTNDSYGLVPMILMIWAALGATTLGLSLFAISRRRGAPAGTGIALASLLAIPAVLFVAFPGTCLWLFVTSQIRY
ncbi:MAG TPA: hypothetical protein VIU37_08440 [Candidatus Limnocylindrales bacterium]